MSTGVPYVLGTDAYHGYLYREVGYAVARFRYYDRSKVLPPMPRRSADWGDQIGSLKERLCRDIIAVDGNPLTDVECLANVPFVMQDGNIVKRK